MKLPRKWRTKVFLTLAFIVHGEPPIRQNKRLRLCVRYENHLGCWKRQQTAYNDVNESNQKQAEFLLEKIGEKFQEQNEILARILEKLEG